MTASGAVRGRAHHRSGQVHWLGGTTSKPLNPPLPRGETLPAGFHEVCCWRISDRRLRVVAINLSAFAELPPAWLFFGVLAVTTGKLPASISFGTEAMLLTLAAIIVTLIVHELARGALVRFYGARPTFGAITGRLVLYATAPGHAFRRLQYISIALAPLAVISLIALALINVLAGSALLIPVVICAALNVAGIIPPSSVMGDRSLIWVTIRFAKAHLLFL